MNTVTEREDYLLGETIFDMTVCAFDLGYLVPQTAEGCRDYYYNRELYEAIFGWANEFEKTLDRDNDDYPTKLQDFTKKKLEAWEDEREIPLF